jgi:hypothetical protein
LVTDKPAPITVALAQKTPASSILLALEKSDSKSATGVPVLVNPVIMKNTEGESDLGLKMLVGPDDVSVQKKKTALAQTSNPVNNPPWNNWSVNQPSVPHNHGLAGKADLGQNIIVDGHQISYAQQ